MVLCKHGPVVPRPEVSSDHDPTHGVHSSTPHEYDTGHTQTHLSLTAHGGCISLSDKSVSTFSDLTQLPAAVKAGKVTEADLDKALLRLTTLQMELGLFDPKVIPTPLHVLGRISPISSPFFSVFLRVFTVSTRRF